MENCLESRTESQYPTYPYHPMKKYKEINQMTGSYGGVHL